MITSVAIPGVLAVVGSGYLVRSAARFALAPRRALLSFLRHPLTRAWLLRLA
jgi:hypothetical protein